MKSFDIVAVNGNKVECCFDKVEHSFDNVACCFDIVAGVDGALWNSLPSGIQSSSSLPVFRQRLNHFFFVIHFVI